MQFSQNQETYEIACLLITHHLCHAIASSGEMRPAASIAFEIFEERLPIITDLEV